MAAVTLVEGQPGTGKSRLLRDAADEAARQGFSRAAGAAEELGGTIPIFALRAQVPGPPAWPAVDDGSRDLPAAPAWRLSQLRGRLAHLASAGPVLVCLDDLHWAGPAALAALRALPGELKRYPVAWLLARSSTPPGTPSSTSQQDTEYLFSLLGRDGAARITLRALGDDAVAALLTDAFGAPPDEALLALASGAEGNPWLLTELIGGLRDDHAVRTAGGRAVLVSGELPRRVSLAGRQRLGGLSGRTGHLLMTAAVLGASFRLEDAAEMLGETPAALLPAIEEAMGAGLVTAAEHAFSFRPELLRRAAGDMIPRALRDALHRQYGQILLRRGDSAAEAAGHLLAAARHGDPTSLADLDEAVKQTVDQAPQTAARLALRALELTRGGDQETLRRSVAAGETLAAAGRLDETARVASDALAKPLPPAAEARLRCALSSVLCARGQDGDAHAEARIALAAPRLPAEVRDRALTAQLQALAGLGDELGDPVARAILAAQDKHAGHAVVAAYVTSAAAAWDRGRISEALGRLRDAVRHGGGVSPDARHAQPMLALAASLIDLRQLAEAESILRAVDSQALRGIPAEAAPPVLRARIHLANGRLADAAADGQTALAIAETRAAHGFASVARSVLGVIALRRGDVPAAAAQVAGLSVPVPYLAARYARGEAIMAAGAIGEARDGSASVIGHVRQVCADLPARPGYLLGDPAMAAWVVRAALAAGDDEAAACAASTAEALARDNPAYPAVAAAAAHSLGLVTRDPVRLRQAVAQHSDPWAKASAAEDLGVMYVRQADQERAVHHFTQALGGYQLAGAVTDTTRIRHRLTALGARGRRATPAERPVTGWQSLTGTERAVAELAAQGLNNQQIADQMYISVHTVAFHLRQTFRKLGIGSRVQLARIAAQRGQQAVPPSIRGADPRTGGLTAPEL